MAVGANDWSYPLQQKVQTLQYMYTSHVYKNLPEYCTVYKEHKKTMVDIYNVISAQLQNKQQQKSLETTYNFSSTLLNIL